MKGSPVEMKSKEPDLNPEKSARDYTVHFPQPEKAQDGAPKNYKVSGPVAPDTIRYQWTDDGFGGKTYMKRLKTPTSPRTPRKRQPKTPAQQSKTTGSDHVTLPVGSRSLDKKTLASLILVQRLNERKAGGSRTAPVVQPSSDKENVAYSYHLQYLTFCQPVGPRLGECDKPSSVNWYLQGEHGLYRDPGIRSVTDSDLVRSKRTEVRIPKERSLVIEGKHIGGEVTEPEVTKEALSSSSISTIGSDQSSGDDAQVDLMITSKETVRSPRTPSVSPRASPSLLKKPVSVPTGTRSRPSSARSEQPEPKFSVKQFKHFCWPDDPELMDDYKRQLEAWAAVNIQRIFRGHMARQYAHQLKFAKNERERKAAIQLQSTFRGFLTRKRLMERKMMNYAANIRNEEWARQYQEDLKKREAARHQKKQQLLIKQNKEFGKRSEQVKHVQATQTIYDAFHPTPEGPTKAQKKAAAIVIQKYFRGWFVRRMFKKVKEKALKRTLSFGKFTRNYQALIYRIQRRYGIENPTTALQFNELMEYVVRLNKYEITFEKFAADGVIYYKDIKEFFKACGHCPSQKEIDDAIAIVIKESAKDRNLTKAEAVEVLFQIYVLKGTGLKLSNVRKSTWMNPLVNGQDAMYLLSKKDLEETNLLKCFDLIAGAEAESEAIKDLLRPASAKKTIYSNNKNSSGKKGAKSSKGTKGRKSSKGDMLLAQYPQIRPSSSGSNRARSKR